MRLGILRRVGKEVLNHPCQTLVVELHLKRLIVEITFERKDPSAQV